MLKSDFQQASYPLHTVVIDSVKLSVNVVDNVTGDSLGFPWLTIGLDKYSKMVWGKYLALDVPGATSLLRTISDGVLKRNASAESSVLGVPETIALTNKSGVRYDVVEMVANMLVCDVEFLSCRPQYRVDVKYCCDALEGYGLLSHDRLGKDASVNIPAFTLDQIHTLITQYFTEVYSHQPHPSLNGLTPLECYQKGIEQFGPPRQVPKEQQDRFRLALLPEVQRIYSQNGVKVHGRVYKSEFPDLSRGKYLIKYDPNDVSEVYIQLPVSGEFIPAPVLTEGFFRERG